MFVPESHKVSSRSVQFVSSVRFIVFPMTPSTVLESHASPSKSAPAYESTKAAEFQKIRRNTLSEKSYLCFQSQACNMLFSEPCVIFGIIVHVASFACCPLAMNFDR